MNHILEVFLFLPPAFGYHRLGWRTIEQAPKNAAAGPRMKAGSAE